jgi:hypothetical protein
MNKQRSPLTLDIVEVLVAVLVLVIAELGLYYGLQSTGPYFPDAVEDFPELLTRMDDERREIFLACTLPLGMIILVSSISLVRGIRMDVRHFSRLGHIASAWPVFSSAFLWHGDLIFLCSWLGLPFLLAGIIVSVISSVRALVSRRNTGDWVALPLNVAWGVFYLYYLVRYMEAFIW